MPLEQAQYTRLLEFRTGLRTFLRWSESQARVAGLTPAQHQLMLAVRGHPDDRGPTIGEIADYLVLRHHSAVGLTDRAVQSGLVVRSRDPEDQRVVRLRLTPAGQRKLDQLVVITLEELDRLERSTSHPWAGIALSRGRHGGPVREPGEPGEAE